MIPLDVCPHCKVPVSSHRFECEGVMITTYHCPEHGDVVPMRSAVSNSPTPVLDPVPAETWRDAERCDVAAAYER